MNQCQCNTCKKEYEPILEGNYYQAYNCASTVFSVEGDYYLVGGYGSRVADMKKYYIKDINANFQTGTICDDCIKRLDKEGKLDLVEDGVWI